MENGASTRGQELAYDLEGARLIYEGLKEAGINFVCFLPDSWNREVVRNVTSDSSIRCVPVSREDEGMAVAMGAYMGGKKPCMIMEGSGWGMCGLVLVRPGMIQRMPLLIISSHTSSFGEQSYSHAESRMVIEPIIRALGIPYSIITRLEDAKRLIREAEVMVEGQTFPAAVIIPRHIYFKDRGR